MTIERQIPPLPFTHIPGPSDESSMPLYAPNAWNDCPRRCATVPHRWHTQGSNNCYNYACNIITNSFAQPGREAGHPPQFPFTSTRSQILDGAMGDGLRPLGPEDPCPECCHKVCVAFHPWLDSDDRITDYHWFRQDADGGWSHKPGWGAVTNEDYGDPGERIVDPERADRGPYTVFGGYFCACRETVRIK